MPKSIKAPITLDMQPTRGEASHAAEPAHLSPKMQGRLDHFPVELLSIIFHDIDDVITIVCLSLTSRLMFDIGYTCLVSRHEEITTWFGDRIICIGNHCMDTPDEVFTATELATLEGRNVYYALSGLSNALTDNFNISDGKKPTIFNSAFWDQVRAMNLVQRPLAEQKKLIELTDIDEVTEFECDMGRPWALCNLTTGEYVRADAIQ